MQFWLGGRVPFALYCLPSIPCVDSLQTVFGSENWFDVVRMTVLNYLLFM